VHAPVWRACPSQEQPELQLASQTCCGDYARTAQAEAHAPPAKCLPHPCTAPALPRGAGAEPAAGLGWLARLLDPERRRLRRGEAAARAPKRSRSDPVIAEAGLARSAGASDAGAQAARAAAPGLAPLRAEQAAHLNS